MDVAVRLWDSRPLQEAASSRFGFDMCPYVQLSRPVNCLISGLSILIAALLARPAANWQAVFWAVLSGMVLTAAANAINDYFDIEIDRINRPRRPLPAGRLQPYQAKGFAIILFVCGVFFSIFINVFAVLIAATSALLLIVYSAKLKRTPLWGNATVSLMTGTAFIYGALAGGRWREGIIPAVYAFLFHFGRELLKDIEDVSGDKAARAQTFPLRYGLQASRWVISGLFSLLVGLTPVPYWLGIYSASYLVVVLVGVDLVLLYVLVRLWTTNDLAELRVLSGILKADMVVGLVAIYIG